MEPATVLAMIPPVAVVLVMQKRFVDGMTETEKQPDGGPYIDISMHHSYAFMHENHDPYQ